MGEIREETLVKLTEVCWLDRCCVGQRCGRWRGAWAGAESAEARIHLGIGRMQYPHSVN